LEGRSGRAPSCKRSIWISFLKKIVIGSQGRESTSREKKRRRRRESTYSEVHRLKAQESGTSSPEVTSSKNERRKVNITSRGFRQERCRWTFELEKVCEARSASA